MKLSSIRKSHYTKNRGMIVIMLAAGMAVMLAMMGLAIDFGHTYLNKTRLQNLADALALTGAKTLNESRSVSQAHSAIDALFNININGPGNSELHEGLSSADLTIEYSDKLNPFVSGGTNPRYVRVKAGSLQLQSWFIRTLGFNEIPVSAVAVSGPSSTLSSYVCDITPLLACGAPGEDPANNNNTSFWGYTPGTIQLLKATSNNKSDCIGPGNFHLISPDGSNSGANAVRESLAGNQQGCSDLSGGITTKPGNNVGPTIQGLNTRFGEYLGPMNNRQDEFPPDVITTETTTNIELEDDICQGGQSQSLDFNWADYQQSLSSQNYNNAPPSGVANRRVMKVVIGDCDNTSKSGGRTTVPYLGVGCFFLLKKATNNNPVYGEFIEECMLDGSTGSQSQTQAGPYKIILHENPVVL